MADPSADDLIRASGCVIYRRTGAGSANNPDSTGNTDSTDGRKNTDGEIEVLIAHRPLYDDWDFPKGKLEKGETDLQCAIRETLEETGYTGVIGDELPADNYIVRGRDKLVRWWLLEQTGGAFVANDEVDEIRWVSPKEAARQLSYDHPKSLLRFVPGQG